MAQIENSATERKGKAFSRCKRQVIKIDMTPMVDIGFLLITFFVFTTTMSSQKATDLFMPKDDATHPTNLPKSLALTLLLDNDNKIFCYHGDFNDALKNHEIFETTYSTNSGSGKVIRQKQKEIDVGGKFADGRKGMMLLIKPTSTAKYKNVVDALDEAVINDVKKYAIIEPTKEELNFINGRSRE